MIEQMKLSSVWCFAMARRVQEAPSKGEIVEAHW
jgi:hypothetical protein